jgi:membrane associated rhomboid family serine protease
VILHLNLARFGIVPRTESGLVGIAFAPLLHGSRQHLLANAVPLFVLLVVLLSNPVYRPYQTLLWIWAASGLGTWLIGRGNAVHIGASSVIFGLAAFLIAAGFFLKSWRTALIAIFVFLLYGGIFYGVLPQNGPISWEGHLSGAIAGVWAARAQRKH